jgi:hypothetical protein
VKIAHNTVSMLIINAIPNNPTSFIAGGTIKSNLPVGETTFTITVIAEDKRHSRDYTLTVTRSNGDGENTTNISNLNITSGHIYTFNQMLHVDTPVSEQITVYSVAGQLLHQTQKPAGGTLLPINSNGLLIVRGSSGWAQKVIYNPQNEKYKIFKRIVQK